jgi:hypothetical protein
MADKKISQLTAKGSRIVASDRVPIAQDDGGGTFSTKYVLGSEVHNWSLNKESASYTLLLTDAHNYVEMEVSSANILTIPTNATVDFPIGTEIRVTQLGTGQTTITPAAGVTLRSISGKDKTTGQYSVATLFKRGLNEWYLFGDITT